MRSLKVGETEVAVLSDEAAVALAATERIVAALQGAFDERGEAHLALSGGSSATCLYKEMALPKWGSALAWDQVHMWWGDERFVPLDHPESNAGLAYRLLFAEAARSGESGEGGAGVDVTAGDLRGLPIDVLKVHPVEVEDAIGLAAPVDVAAELYATDIDRLVPKGVDGVPVFDVFLAGVGADGHTLSLFPGGAGQEPDAPFVIAVPAPQHIEPHIARVTLTARVMAAAHQVLVLTSGDAKAEVIAQVLGNKRDSARWPAQVARLPNAVWLLDEAGAARLTG